MTETINKQMRLTVMAAWFMEHPEPAKKRYMMTVMTMEPRYMVKVEPIKSDFQNWESVFSTFSRQYSAQL